MNLISVEWRFRGDDIEWRMLDPDKRKSKALKRRKWITFSHGVGVAEHIPGIMGDILKAHIRYAVHCRYIKRIKRHDAAPSRQSEEGK